MRSIVCLLFFLLLGYLVSMLTGGFLPAGVAGMILLFGALALGWIREEWVRSGAEFLVKNMLLFFVPVSIGIMDEFSLLNRHLLAILVSVVVSSTAVIVTVALLSQKMEKRR